MSFYKVKVNWYNEIADKVEEEFSLTYGENYAEAITRIVECYGELALENVFLECIYDGEVLPIKENTLNDLELV